MVSKIINDWLREGISDTTGSKREVRRENTFIPVLANDKGIIQTPKPLFSSFIDKTKLDPYFLPEHLSMIEKQFIQGASVILGKSETDKEHDSALQEENLDMKHTNIEYDRNNIFLSRVMFSLFEMPDISVRKSSPQYSKVVERNELYQKALAKRKNLPDDFIDKSMQTDVIDKTVKQIETIPLIIEDKSCMVNNYLMLKHYNRLERKITPPPKTFEEFCKENTKFRNYNEFISTIDKYPAILGRLREALYVTEKTLNYNTFQYSVLEYNGYETIIPLSDDIVESNNEDFINTDRSQHAEQKEIKFHLNFQFDEMKENYQATCIECSLVNPSVFVAGYGVSRFEEMDHDPRGMVLFWNIHKCGYPEKVFYTEEIVTCLEFSRSEPYIVAVGMRYGLVAIFDLRKSDLFSCVNNYSSKTKPSGSVTSVRWLKKKYAMGKEIELLLSISKDGVINSWALGRQLDGNVVRYIKRGSNLSEREQRMVIAIDTAGLCMQVKPESDEVFIVGTIEGQVLQAELGDPDSYSHIYNCHNGPVYDLQWSPFLNDVFITSGTDRFIHIWQSEKDKPSKSLLLEDVTLRVVWSQVKSTLFAAMCDRRVLFFDLSVDLHKEIAELTADENVTFTFLTFCPKNNWFLVGQSDATIKLHQLLNIPTSTIDQEKALRNTFLSDI